MHSIYQYVRKLALLAVLAAAAFSEVQATPAAPKPVAPADWQVLLNPDYTQITWSAVRGAVEYEIQLVTLDSPVGRIVKAYRTTTPSFSIRLYVNCAWIWSVRARDGSGWGPSSAQRTFYTWDGIAPRPDGGVSSPGTPPVTDPKPQPVNQAPVVKGPYGPTVVTGSVGVAQTYTVSVRDDGLPKNPGRTTWTWRVTRVAVPGRGGIETPVGKPVPTIVGGTHNSVRIGFPASGRYLIEVMATDGAEPGYGSLEVVVKLTGEPFVPLR